MNLTDAKRIAEDLVAEHLPEGWSFKFNSAKRSFGSCRWVRGEHQSYDEGGRGTIQLSRHLVELNDEAHTRETILHEIAHAIAGYHAAHGPAWKAACLEVGCEPRATYRSDQVVTPKPRYLVRKRIAGVDRYYERHAFSPKMRREVARGHSQVLDRKRGTMTVRHGDEPWTSGRS